MPGAVTRLILLLALASAVPAFASSSSARALENRVWGSNFARATCTGPQHDSTPGTHWAKADSPTILASECLLAPRAAGKLRVCFPAGTPVSTPEGNRAIDELQEGDEVYSWDLDTDEIVVRPVTATFQRATELLVEVATADGETVDATASHPFWVLGTGWVEAGDLRVGMELLTANGASQEITSLGSRAGLVAVYNIEVGDEHNYFVGENSVLVHNMDVINTDANRAVNEALNWLKGQGVDTSKVSGPFNAKFGPHKGKPIGLRFERGGYYRIEFDARSGAHINVGVGKNTGPHIKFEGSQRTVNKLIRRFFRC